MSTINYRTKQVVEENGKIKFKYIKFADRLKRINPDVVHRISRVEELEPEEGDSYFNASLQEWRDLNCTLDFQRFCQEVQSLVNTFNQVVFYKDDIVQVLLNHLNKDQSLAMDALLNLVTMLAKDLRDDFYPYFAQFILCFSKLLKQYKQDADMIEKIFEAIGYLFKYLKRLLAANFMQTFTDILPLLMDDTEFVKWFAAPSLAFVLRKVPDGDALRDVIKQMLQIVDSQQNISRSCLLDSVAALFAECMKGIGNLFHFKASRILALLLDNIQHSKCGLELTEKTLILLLVHGDSDSNQDIVSMLLSHAQNVDMQQHWYIIKLTVLVLAVRKGTRVQKSIQRIGEWCTTSLISSIDLVQLNESQIVDLASLVALLLNASYDNDRLLCSLRYIFSRISAEQVLQFCSVILKICTIDFAQLILPVLTESFQLKSTDDQLKLVQWIFCHQCDGTICLDGGRKLDLGNSVDQVISDGSLTELTAQLSDQHIALLSLLPFIVIQDEDALKKFLLEILKQRLKECERNGDDSIMFSEALFLAKILHSLGVRLSCEDFASMVKLAIQLKYCGNVVFLSVVYEQAERLQMISADLKESIGALLLENLVSPVRSCRLLSLQILSSISECSSVQHQILNLLVQLEQVEYAPENSREMVRIINKIKTLVPRISKSDLYMLPKICVGMLTANYKPLWAPVLDLMWTFVSSYPNGAAKNPTWEVIWNFISLFDSLLSSDYLPRMFNVSAEQLCLWQELQKKTLQADLSGDEQYKGNYHDITLNQIASLTFPLYKASAVNVYAQNLLQNFELLSNMRVDWLNVYSLLCTSLKDNSQRLNKLWIAHIAKEYLRLYDQCQSHYEHQLYLRSRHLFEVLAYNSSLSSISEDILLNLRKRSFDILCRPDVQMQKSALKLLKVFSELRLSKYIDDLLALVDEKTFRETLARCSISEESDWLQSEDRQFILPILLRILFSKSFSGQGGKNVQQLRSNRQALMSYLVVMDENELNIFVDLLLGDYEAEDAIADKEVKNIIGLMSRLLDLVTFMKTAIVPVVSRLWNVMSLVQKSVDVKLQQDLDSPLADKWKQVRTLISKTVLQFFKIRSSDALSQQLARCFDEMFNLVIRPRLSKFADENLQQASTLLQLFHLWSYNEQYLPFLSGEAEQIFYPLIDLLSGTNVKSEVVDMTLSIFENLLSFAKGDNVNASAILKMVSGRFMLSLKAAFCNLKSDDGIKSKILRRQVSLLSNLVDYIGNDTTALTDYVSLLLPYLTMADRQVSQEQKANILKIVASVLPQHLNLLDDSSDVNTLQRAVSSFTLCLRSLTLQESRLLLCQCFQTIAIKESRYERVCQLLNNLNAFKRGRVDEADWSVRLNCVSQINDTLLDQLDCVEWGIILNQYLYFVQVLGDQSLRQSASYGMRKFISLAAKLQDDSPLKSLLDTHIFSFIKNGVKSLDEDVRTEFVLLMDCLILEMPDWSKVAGLGELRAGGDEEANFFNNIIHLQLHRRAKAIRRFTEHLKTDSSQQIPSSTLVNVFMPIFMNNLLSAEKKIHDQIVVDSIHAIAAICRRLTWSQYYSVYSQLKKLFDMKGQKSMLRALLAVLEQFHWKAQDGCEQECSAMDALSSKILPYLYKILNMRTEDDSKLAIRIPVALTYAQLLQNLSDNVFVYEIKRLFTCLVYILRSRSQEVRDQARNTLVKIVKLLGHNCLEYLVKELRSALTKGYQLHVLGYSLSSIIIDSFDVFTIGAFDRCMDVTLSILFTDIFGLVGEQKEVEELARQSKEYRGCRSIEAFECLSAVLSPSSLQKVMDRVASLLDASQGRSFSVKMGDVLRKFSIGLLRNSGLDSDALMSLIQSLLQPVQSSFYAKQKHSTTLVESIEQSNDMDVDASPITKTESSQAIKHYFDQNKHLLIELGLNLLRGLLKRDQVDDSEQWNRILEQLSALLEMKETGVLNSCLKCVCQMLNRKLQLSSDVLSRCCNLCVNIVLRHLNLNNALVQECLRLLAVTLKSCPDIELLNEHQLTAILKMIKPDIPKSDEHSVIFSFIRSVLAKRMMAPILYDIIDECCQCAVTHQSGHVQSVCRSIVVQFYLDYPAGENKIKKLFQFVASNMSYDIECGRLSVMQMLELILIKFPADVIDAQGEALFMALVMCLANDQSPRCKEKAAQVLDSLFPMMSQKNLAKVENLITLWFDGENTLKSLGVQVLRIIILSQSRQNDDDNSCIVSLKSLDMFMQKCFTVFDQSLGDDQDWQLRYQCLVFLSKCLQANNLVVDDHLLELVMKCMLDVHAWVRLASSRLVLQVAQSQPHSLALHTNKLMRLSLNQLKSSVLDEQQCALTLDNLKVIGDFEYSQCLPSGFTPRAADVQDSTSDDQDQAQNLLSLYKRAIVMAKLEQNSPSVLVRRVVIEWLTHIADSVSKEDLCRILPTILPFIYRTSQDETTVVTGFEEVKTQCHLTMRAIEKKIGTSEYFRIQQEVQMEIQKVKNERLREKQLMAVSDPQRYEQRKVQKRSMKQNAKKRKVEENNIRYGKKLRQ
ncbi:hypothetical protein MIR68_004655 [Amoeboaphelidium protococcarum]|nr:hypothetical protein MIR68_004655 [Amoeboaphelidium protococcarum]